jgi:outer membrane receptor protein involved in Fe transport
MTRLRWLTMIAVLALGAAIGAVSLAAAADGEAERSSATAPNGVERVDVAARLAAGAAGEPAPTNVQIAKGDLRTALTTLNPLGGGGPSVIDPRTGRPWAESPVYVVTMNGHFQLKEAHVPRGQPLPQGSVMELVIDALSERVVSRHVQSTPGADLRQLGGAVVEG